MKNQNKFDSKGGGKVEGEKEVKVIQGKHGIIEMVFPKREPTAEEMDALYKELAAIMVECENMKTPTE